MRLKVFYISFNKKLDFYKTQLNDLNAHQETNKEHLKEKYV